MLWIQYYLLLLSTDFPKHGLNRSHDLCYYSKYREVKCDVTKIQICEIKEEMKKANLPKISPSEQVGEEIQAPICFEDRVQILLKLAWIATLTIQPCLREIIRRPQSITLLISPPIGSLLASATFFVLLFLDMPANLKIFQIEFLWRHPYSPLLRGGWIEYSVEGMT